MVFLEPPQILMKYHIIEANIKLTMATCPTIHRCIALQKLSFMSIFPIKNSSTFEFIGQDQKELLVVWRSPFH
jgi:hypothetical protein